MKTGSQKLDRSEQHELPESKGAAKLRIYLILCLFQLVSATRQNKGHCQTVGFRIQTFVTIPLEATFSNIDDDYDCSGFCNHELNNLRDNVLFNSVAGIVMLNVPPTASSFRAQRVYLDHCILHKRYCVQFWRALAMARPIAAAVDPSIRTGRASTKRMTNDPTDAANLEKKGSTADTTEQERMKKIDCFCDALYVLPRIRRIIPLWYPDQKFECEHEAICHRLTDLQLLRINKVYWKCIDSAPLIETEHCHPTSNMTPSACPCAHDHFTRMRIAGLPTRLGACEDWKSNPKAIELLSKAPLTASKWKTFRRAESTNARDTNTISSQSPGARARPSTSQNSPLVHRPWLTTGSTPRQNQPWLYSGAGPTTLGIDSLQHAKLARPIREPREFASAAPRFHLKGASTSRASDSRREVSLTLADFSSPTCQAQNDQRSDAVKHSQSGSLLWQNLNQPNLPPIRFDPFGQFLGSSSQQETESLDAIERRAALFDPGVQSFSSFAKEITRHLPAAVQDQTQTRPSILPAAGSGSKRKADQMHITPNPFSQSLLNLGGFSFAARLGIDAETIAAAAQCPMTPAEQIEVVHPASTIDLEVLPASKVGISSLDSSTDQMPEFIHTNDETAAANQAQETDQDLIEPPDEWAWRFL